MSIGLRREAAPNNKRHGEKEWLSRISPSLSCQFGGSWTGMAVFCHAPSKPARDKQAFPFMGINFVITNQCSPLFMNINKCLPDMREVTTT